MSKYISTTNEIVINELERFLNARDYLVSDKNLIKKNDYVLTLNSNNHPRNLKINIRRIFCDGVVATLSDDGDPYLCSEGMKYEFRFRKKFPSDGKPLLSYTQKTNSQSAIGELFSDWIYGTKNIQLKKLYEIMPELKSRVEFRIIDTLSETILNTTTAARVMTNFGDDAYFILMGGVSTGMEIFAENYFTKKATKITSRFPQARYALLQESPMNTINKIVERRDVSSWVRFMEITKKIAPKYGLSPTYSATASRISKLEKILIESPEKLNEEISGWRIYEDEQFKKALTEIEPINYGAVKKDLSDYIQFLESKDLLKKNVDAPKIVEKTASGFAGKTVPELKKNLSDKIRRLIKDPTKEEYLEAISWVKKDLEKNLWSDTGIFLSKYPLAWIAASNLAIPATVLLSSYVGLEIFKVGNSVGFERMNNILRLNYILEELNKDPTISGGADMENIFDAQISKLESVTAMIGTAGSMVGQIYSKKTNGLTNHFMDGLAFILMSLGVKKWYKYMNSTIQRCENELKASSELLGLDGT